MAVPLSLYSRQRLQLYLAHRVAHLAAFERRHRNPRVISELERVGKRSREAQRRGSRTRAAASHIRRRSRPANTDSSRYLRVLAFSPCPCSVAVYWDEAQRQRCLFQRSLSPSPVRLQQLLGQGRRGRYEARSPRDDPHRRYCWHCARRASKISMWQASARGAQRELGKSREPQRFS